MQVVFIILIKGGVGKIIMVVNFGGFVVDVGLCVLLFDFDVQFILFLYYELGYCVFGGIYELLVFNECDFGLFVFCMNIEGLDLVFFNDY